MKSSRRDRAEGKLLAWKGGLKKMTGEAVGSPSLKTQGQTELAEGRWQQRLAQIKRLLGK